MPSVALKTAAPPASQSAANILNPMDRQLDRTRITPAGIAMASLGLVLIAVATYGYIAFGLTRTIGIARERVTVSEVRFATFRDYVPISGNVVPGTTVYLDTVEGGQIMGVHAEPGALVSAGEPLVTLRNTNLQLEVIGREAQLTEQLHNLSSTSLAFERNRLFHRRELIEIDHRIDSLIRNLERSRPLIEVGGASQMEIEDLEADLHYQRELRGAVLDAQSVDVEIQGTQIETLREAISAMSRNLELARENLANLVVAAPISGQLTAFEASVGESKAPGQRIGQIDELGAFKVKALVDEFYLARVSLGQIATVEIDGQTYELEVVKSYPDVRDRLFEVDLDFIGDAPHGIRRGQTVRMQLDIGQPADTLVIDNGAFFEDTGGLWLFLLHEDGRKAERHAVRLGRRNPEGVEVLSGLTAGDKVITSAYGQFSDFDRIELDPAYRVPQGEY